MTDQIQNNPAANTLPDDEIDLIALAKNLWKGRKTILIVTAVFAVLGVFVAIFSPKEYTATTVVVPQVGKSASKLGGLSSLAAMAGFSLDMQASETLSPMVYPQLVGSAAFQLELMNTTFTVEGISHPVSLYEFFTDVQKPGLLAMVKKYTIGLPFVILKAIKGEKVVAGSGSSDAGPIALTPKQEDVRKLISEQVTLEVNSKEGYLTLTSRMPEARLSAEVAYQARELLQKYITRLKIEKATDQLNFIQARYNEKKKEFEKAQMNLAWFRDRNRNVATSIGRTEEERLQSEFTIAFNVYSELAKQLEQAQIQVKEDTPVLSVLAPATVPAEKSKPKKAQILLIWIFIGAVIGVGIVFGKDFLGTIKKKWNEETPAL
ncbi:MAG TPA: Wzz/FepE/Etk N-terminal domain-containing protein [Prolixibacteraceae bacterium]|nr:Wzz/FepE/Etk N-terminal domain-containing protein [Prolixibacteraceae bacterium]